jgi:hypothetical protein
MRGSEYVVPLASCAIRCSTRHPSHVLGCSQCSSLRPSQIPAASSPISEMSAKSSGYSQPFSSATRAASTRVRAPVLPIPDDR